MHTMPQQEISKRKEMSKVIYRMSEYAIIEANFRFKYKWDAEKKKAYVSNNGSYWGNELDGWTCIYLNAHPRLKQFVYKNHLQKGTYIVWRNGKYVTLTQQEYNNL
jgi:hypothetical protein